MRQRRGRFRVTCFRLQEISWDQRKTLRDERSYRQGVFISRRAYYPGTIRIDGDQLVKTRWRVAHPLVRRETYSLGRDRRHDLGGVLRISFCYLGRVRSCASRIQKNDQILRPRQRDIVSTG